MSQTRHPLISGDRQFQLLSRSIPGCAFLLLDPNGVVISRSDADERLRGYSTTEIIGAHYSIFYEELDRKARLPQQDLAVAAERGHFATQAWRVREDGSRFWASVTIEALKAGNRLLGFAVIARDITADKFAELRRERDEAQYRAIFDTLIDGIAPTSSLNSCWHLPGSSRSTPKRSIYPSACMEWRVCSTARCAAMSASRLGCPPICGGSSLMPASSNSRS
jgi:PAS domain S-box-containing protein